MKVVLDTNVWVSSLLLPKSVPGRIVTAWKEGAFEIVISSAILDELKEVLNYPKIKKRLFLTTEEVEEFFSLIRFFSEWVEIKNIKTNFIKKIRDHHDEPILSTLIIGESNYLVTGDKDLLELNQDYPILTPNQFAEFLE